MPEKHMAYKYGLLSQNYRLLWGMAACDFWLLGFPSRLKTRKAPNKAKLDPMDPYGHQPPSTGVIGDLTFCEVHGVSRKRCGPALLRVASRNNDLVYCWERSFHIGQQ